MGAREQLVDQALSDFVRGNATFVRDNLGPDSSDLSSDEVLTVCNFLFRLEAVAELRARKERSFDEGLSMRMRPHHQRYDRATFIKAIEWLDRGQILKSRLAEVVSRTTSNSPAVDAYLKTRRIQAYRKSFDQINATTVAIRDELFALFHVVNGLKKPVAPSIQKEIAGRFKTLRNLVQKVTWHSKAGAAMAISAGFRAENAERAVGRLSLNRLDGVVRLAHRIEHRLWDFGLREQLVQNVWRRYDALRAELSDATLAQMRQKNTFTTPKAM